MINSGSIWKGKTWDWILENGLKDVEVWICEEYIDKNSTCLLSDEVIFSHYSLCCYSGRRILKNKIPKKFNEKVKKLLNEKNMKT